MTITWRRLTIWMTVDNPDNGWRSGWQLKFQITDDDHMATADNPDNGWRSGWQLTIRMTVDNPDNGWQSHGDGWRSGWWTTMRMTDNGWWWRITDDDPDGGWRSRWRMTIRVTDDNDNLDDGGWRFGWRMTTFTCSLFLFPICTVRTFLEQFGLDSMDG